MQSFSPSFPSSPEFHIQPEPFLRICRYAQYGTDFPRLFYNALSLLDSKEGSDSFHLLFRFQTLCRECLALTDKWPRLIRKLSSFEEHLSDFCKETVAAIRNLPAAEQCRMQALSDSMRRQLVDMQKSAADEAADSLRFQKKVDNIRRQMENEIQPQAAVFRKMLDAQENLVIQNQWMRCEIPNCGFLKDNPVVRGLMQSLERASSQQEADQIWNGLHQTAADLWNHVQDAFTYVGAISQDLDQIGADIRGLNVLWTSTGMYLRSIEEALSAAVDSQKLLIIRSQLEICATQCENTARICQDFAKQLNV